MEIQIQEAQKRNKKKKRKEKQDEPKEIDNLRYYNQKFKERTLKAARYKWLLYKRENS